MFNEIRIKQNNKQSHTNLTGFPRYPVTRQLPPKFQIIIFKAKHNFLKILKTFEKI